MFLRKKEQKGKIYYSLEERLWDAGTGKVKTKVIAGLGQKPRASLWELYEEGKIKKDVYSELIKKLPPEQHIRKEFTVKELLKTKERIDIPLFARSLVWGQGQKSSYIHGLLVGFPFSDICLYPKADGNYLLIDGQQRLDCVLGYINNNYYLISQQENTNGKRFNDLSEELQETLLKATIPVLIINKEFSIEDLAEIFIRLNNHQSL